MTASRNTPVTGNFKNESSSTPSQNTQATGIAPETSLPTFGQVNEHYWDAHAADIWKEPWVIALSQQISTTLQTCTDWPLFQRAASQHGATVRLLDYACGPGLASKALLSHFQEVRGIDVSSYMVTSYGETAKELGVSSSKMRACIGDLLAPQEDQHQDLASQEYFNFDAAVVSMALHHVQEPGLLVKRLVERLKPGGVLLIVDWTLGDRDDHNDVPDLVKHGLDHAHGVEHVHDHHDHHDHHNHHDHHGHHEDQGEPNPANHTVAFAGFNREQMTRMFREAGCSEMSFKEFKDQSKVPTNVNFKGYGQMYLAYGIKSGVSSFFVE